MEANDQSYSNHHNAASPRRKSFNLHLGQKLRKAFHHGSSKSVKDTNDNHKENRNNLQPPEIALNDAKLALSRDSCESDSKSQSEASAISLLQLPLGFMGMGEKKKANTFSPQFLTVSNIPPQRKRSRSINIDDRLKQAYSQFLDPKNCTSSRQNLHKSVGLTRSMDVRSFEEIRSFLQNKKKSPLKKFFFTTLLESHTCEELVPSSSKVIVLDSKLPIAKAFIALFHNNLRAAPVWNSHDMSFDGMMTVTDFIHALLEKHQMALDVNFEKFSRIKIESLKKTSGRQKKLVYALSDSTLSECLHLLVSHNIHRVPVFDVDDGANILTFASHRSILQFIHRAAFHKPFFYSQTVGDLRIGSYGKGNFKAVQGKMITWEVLKMFKKTDVSVIAIVDEQNKFMGLYSKEDVFHLGANQLTEDFMVPVDRWLNKFSQNRYKLCKSSDKLSTVISNFCSNKVRHLVILDSNKCLEGIISIADVNKFLLANQKDSSIDTESPLSSVGSPVNVSASSLASFQ